MDAHPSGCAVILLFAMWIPISDAPIACFPHFEVAAESGDWIVVDKGAPLIVHPSNGKKEPNLLEGVEALLSYEIVNGAALSLVNRLDRETSGLTLIAKNKAAARELGRACSGAGCTRNTWQSCKAGRSGRKQPAPPPS